MTPHVPRHRLPRWTWLILVITPILFSCHIPPRARDLAAEAGLPATLAPESTDSEDGVKASPPDRWWESFGSAELDRLVNESLRDGLSLKTARERLRQAEALARQAGARRLPELSATMDASTHRSAPPGGATVSDQEYAAGLSVSYVADVWGKALADASSAGQERVAARHDVEAAAMALAGDVADRWLQLVTETARRQLLDEQSRTNQTYLELTELRFRTGLAGALDVYQQRQAVARVASEISLSDMNREILAHELAALSGRAPQAFRVMASDVLPDPPPAPAVGLPSSLLEKRPDIRASAARLLAAEWDVVSARADLLPSIDLSASAMFTTTDFSRIFEGWLTKLAAGLGMPLFDAGRREAEVDRLRSKAEERLLAYRNTVLTALREVADALTREAAQRRHVDAVAAELDIARQSLRESRERYLRGLNDYLPVLSDLKTVQSLEQDLLRQRGQSLRYRVALHLALGGTWTEPLVAGNAPEAGGASR